MFNKLRGSRVLLILEGLVSVEIFKVEGGFGWFLVCFMDRFVGGFVRREGKVC